MKGTLFRVRLDTWLMLGVVGLAVLLVAFVGLWSFMSMTPPLHPDADAVPMDARSTPPADWAGAVQRGRDLARAHLVERSLPGLSVAVGVGGEIVWAEGMGFADLETRTPVTPDTRFLIGTASVPLTSAAVGLLVERGRLALDESVRTYVPDFPEKPSPVTLGQLMAHTAGLRTDGGDEGPYDQHCDRAVDSLRIYASQSLLFEPGTSYRYSNYGWMLVSAAVESAAQEPFLTFMRRGVFEPIGMTRTLADTANRAVPDLATSYFPRFAGDPRYGYHGMRPIDLSCWAGAGVFVSTPSDLVRFAMAMNGGTLLQPSTTARLQASQRLPSGAETGYGLGWDLETADIAGTPTSIVGHDGDVLGGPSTSLWTLPGRGIVVALTSNISYADTYPLAVRILEAFAGGSSRSGRN